MRDRLRHGCRSRAYRDVFTACPAACMARLAAGLRSCAFRNRCSSLELRVAPAPTSTCSRTNSEGCSERARNAERAASVAGPLPSATARLRSHRSWPRRYSGVPAARSANCSALHANSSTRVAASRPWRGAKSASQLGRANLFHGQTSWQSSQPNTRLPISGRRSSRDRALQLDGEIGNAAPRVEHEGRHERSGGADLEAGGAAAAVHAGEPGVHRQRDVGEDLAEEEPRARVRIDQHGVLADPAEAGLLRHAALQHRRAVDEHALRAARALGEDAVREPRSRARISLW